MAYFYVLCSKNILTKHSWLSTAYLSLYQDEILSCELYSLSWSCFRSRGAGTIASRKWCFVLHVQSDPQPEGGNWELSTRKFLKTNVFVRYINKLHHFAPPENISWLRPCVQCCGSCVVSTEYST